MPEPHSISRMGNQLSILMDDDTSRWAVPTGGGMWLVTDNAPAVVPPPDPPIDPGGAQFMFPFPVSGITDGFKTASRPTHEGVDWGGAGGQNTPAAATGIVAWHVTDHPGWGNVVRLEHTVSGVGTVSTLYAHQVEGSVVVSVGQSVVKGQKLGIVGNTGRSFGAHLHFETWQGVVYGTCVDPIIAIPNWNRGVPA